MPKTPLYLITGFLGSGKTTFIQHVLDYFNGKQRIAIIQNEFAPTNFDGKEIKRTVSTEFDLMEVNNGSVFCVCLLSGFMDSLHAFLQKHTPEIIFMEASGLSDPISIGQIFNSPVLKEKIYLAGTICIVDALHYNKFENLVLRIRHQIQIADIIVINKTDLASHTDDTIEKLNALNPSAAYYKTSFCQIPLNQIFTGNIQNHKKIFFPHTNSVKPEVNSIVFRSSKPVFYEKVNLLVSALAAQALRIKGYLILSNHTTISVQTIGDEIHLHHVSLAIKQSELILIGNNLNLNKIKDTYLTFVC